MRVTFLGTGAVGGVPLYGCDCPACERAMGDPRYVRRPTSALVESGGTRVLIDAGLMDLHERFPPGSLDAIVLTHYHADHVQGLLHLRWGRGGVIPVFGPPDSEGCADLFKHPGLLAFEAARKYAPFEVGGLRFTPLPLIHSKPTLGYAIEDGRGGRFAYLTDTLGLPPGTMGFLQGWGGFEMALDCTFPPRDEPRNHNDWHLARRLATEAGARRTWLTHIGHELDAWRIAEGVDTPPGVAVAGDGDIVEISAGDR
ncbi:MAG: phosphonate metabolism protein PhnP [Halomonas sp.]|uniref:phosphonate metabolism protein PhnP n=1 Tax=Halomonas sp. TaxID=1486246 RepID=UPI0019EEB0D0|nr:phosphonate metabolism protein PhnP [Halomonas sp.]MBE0489375.1 phosphonate metabolism protein PhnP [Halomonas sp.]